MVGIPFLIGKEIYLRLLVETDSEGAYPIWFNDMEVCRENSHHIFPYRLEETRKYIQQADKNRHLLILAIICHKDDAHIGNIALDNINYINRTAELTIVIGDKSCWGKGYGKEAARLICDHGFFVLNLNRVACGTFESNVGMRKLAEYLGMCEEGRRRKAAYKLGRYVDVIEYGVLKEEYVARFNFSCCVCHRRNVGER
jgi:[ribosomal protein S5]-alanine N-acetyltransferase